MQSRNISKQAVIHKDSGCPINGNQFPISKETGQGPSSIRDSPAAVQHHGLASQYKVSSIMGQKYDFTHSIQLDYSSSFNPESETHMAKYQHDDQMQKRESRSESICSAETKSVHMSQSQIQQQCLHRFHDKYRTHMLKIQGMMAAHTKESDLLLFPNRDRQLSGFKNENQAQLAKILCELGYVQPEQVLRESFRSNCNKLTQLIKWAKLSYYQAHHCHVNSQQVCESALIEQSSLDSSQRQDQKGCINFDQFGNSDNVGLFPSLPLVIADISQFALPKASTESCSMDIEEQGQCQQNAGDKYRQQFRDFKHAQSSICKVGLSGQQFNCRVEQGRPLMQIMQLSNTATDTKATTYKKANRAGSKLTGEQNPHYGYLYYRMMSKKRQKALNNRIKNDQDLQSVKKLKQKQNSKNEIRKNNISQNQEQKEYFGEDLNSNNEYPKTPHQKYNEVFKRKSLSKAIF